MKDPVDHVLRPRLPWRSADEGAVTECGLDASKVKTLERPAYFQRLKDMGQQRSALLTCMTCANTASRWATWEEDPLHALQREINWEGAGRRYEQRGRQLHDELTAVQRLIEAHSDEFAALVREVGERRAWNEKKAAMTTPKSARRGL